MRTFRIYISLDEVASDGSRSSIDSMTIFQLTDLSALISISNDFVAIAKFATTKKEWIGRFLEGWEDVPSNA